MRTQTRQESLDYAFIQKLSTKSEKQLKTLLDTLEKEEIKIVAERTRIDNKLKNHAKKIHFVKDAIMERWRTPSKDLLEAIEEVQRGEVVSFADHQQAMEYLNAEN